jgi:hypothetical protein
MKRKTSTLKFVLSDMEIRRIGDDVRLNFMKKAIDGSNVYTYWNDFIAKKELPIYEWIVNNIFVKHAITDYDNRHNTVDKIHYACNVLEIYQFYSIEFIDHIAKTINQLGARRIIEIGAGDGFLSYFLKRSGIDILPTDDYSRPCTNRLESVERLGHKDSLKKYDPDLVVINWEELDGTHSLDVLKYPSVEHLLWIGEDEYGCTGSRDLWQFDFEDTKNPYCISRTDECLFGDRVNKHTRVIIFRPEKNHTTKDIKF